MTSQVSQRVSMYALDDTNLSDGEFVEANMMTPTRRIFNVEDPNLPQTA